MSYRKLVAHCEHILTQWFSWDIVPYVYKIILWFCKYILSMYRHIMLIYKQSTLNLAHSDLLQLVRIVCALIQQYYDST